MRMVEVLVIEVFIMMVMRTMDYPRTCRELSTLIVIAGQLWKGFQCSIEVVESCVCVRAL